MDDSIKIFFSRNSFHIVHHFQNRKIFHFLKVDKIGDEKFRSANMGSL